MLDTDTACAGTQVSQTEVQQALLCVVQACCSGTQLTQGMCSTNCLCSMAWEEEISILHLNPQRVEFVLGKKKCPVYMGMDT